MAQGVINTSQIAHLMRPGVKGFVTRSERYNSQYKELFKTESSDKQSEIFVEMQLLGQANFKPQGDSLTFDGMAELFTTSIVAATIATGFVITLEAVQDDLYKDIWPKGSQSIIDACNQLKETTGANVLTNAFSGTLQTLADGQPFASTVHPLGVGGSFSNTFSISTTLNETSLEDMDIGIQQFVDAGGLRQHIKSELLVVPPQLKFQAERLMESKFRTGTTTNDISSTNRLNTIGAGYTVNQFLSNPNLYALKTSQEGMIHLKRIPLDIDVNSDPDTFNIKVRGYERWSFGVYNARSAFISQGS